MWTKLLAGAGILALAGFAMWMFGNARFDAGEMAERVRWQDKRIVAEQTIADGRVANERRLTAAAESYARRLAAIDPIIVRSTDTVTRYAETPAGRAVCLAPERVLGIDADAAALFSTAAPGSGGGENAVSADAAPHPAGRVDGER